MSVSIPQEPVQVSRAILSKDRKMSEEDSVIVSNNIEALILMKEKFLTEHPEYTKNPFPYPDQEEDTYYVTYGAMRVKFCEITTFEEGFGFKLFNFEFNGFTNIGWKTDVSWTKEEVTNYMLSFYEAFIVFPLISEEEFERYAKEIFKNEEGYEVQKESSSD